MPGKPWSQKWDLDSTRGYIPSESGARWCSGRIKYNVLQNGVNEWYIFVCVASLALRHRRGQFTLGLSEKVY